MMNNNYLRKGLPKPLQRAVEECDTLKYLSPGDLNWRRREECTQT
jgi:hypothetical protein